MYYVYKNFCLQKHNKTAQHAQFVPPPFFACAQGVAVKTMAMITMAAKNITLVSVRLRSAMRLLIEVCVDRVVFQDLASLCVWMCRAEMVAHVFIEGGELRKQGRELIAACSILHTRPQTSYFRSDLSFFNDCN